MAGCGRVLSVVLMATQVLFAVPAEVWAAQVPQASAASREAPTVSVNRRVPEVTPPPSRPVFSSVPTDAEILRARVFPEPLVPVGVSSPEENVALAAALLAFADRRETNTLGPVARFMDTHTTSVWQPSLLLNGGLVFLQQGFFTRAAHYFRFAWTLAKDLPTPTAQAVADQAVGQLLQLESRLGHADAVETLMADIGTRPLTGAAAEQYSNAKQALWVMRNAPEEAFRCGPHALAQMIRAVKGDARLDATLLTTRTGPNGITLARLTELARQAGVPSTAVIRERGQTFGIPSVVHLKAGHFTAVVRHEGDRYLLRDATLATEMWVTATALNEEASGAMLVPEGGIPTGWRAMTDTEAAAVWGRGLTNGPASGGPKPPNPKTPPRECKGMAAYSAYLMEVSLQVSDIPVGYTPALGPAVMFTVLYNQRESHQPQTFTYSNVGPKWTMDWLSYVTDDPANGNAAVTVFGRGGGEESHTGYDSSTGRFAIDTRDHLLLTRTSSSPIRYERLLPDGSTEVFAQADGASAYPGRVFMTQAIDPQGHALTFTYDAQLRLVAITDAIGQVTTLAYGLSQDVWKVTAVTDPFGRTATFAYDEAGRLQRMTDVIGIWSTLTYTAGGLLTSLTTPYGTSRFTVTDSGFNRTLEMTDPAGGKERLEFRMDDPTMASADPAATVPTVAGATFNNGYLQYRNTLYWDAKAMTVGAGDRTKAHLYHWLHVKDNINQTVSILESEKAALENRVWYLYPNQATPYFEGDGREPTVAARVLDDGSTQAFLAEYNPQGQVTKRTDPVGRETVFTYAANGIDLLTVQQKNGAGYDLLETRTWNGSHQPLTVTDAAGQPTTYTYTAAGQLATVTNARSETATFAYNAANQLTGVTGPISGATAAFTYDGYGRIRTTTGADAYTITIDYDAFDRPTLATYPDGTTEQAQYRYLDVARQKDRLGRWTTFTYDAMRRQTSVRDPLGRVVQQDWCACGSLNALVDPNGNRTSWDRDVQRRVTKETRANGSFTTYGYEATTSRLKTVTDPKLQVTTYGYAKDHALTGVVYTNAAIATPSVSFSYDASYPRLASMVDGIGTTTYTYHAAGTAGGGQVATVDGPLTDDTISYAYDVLGRVSSRSLNSVSSTWTYDALGRVSAQGDPIGTFSYAYDGATARLQQLTYPNGQTSTYAYLTNAGDRRLQDIHHKGSSGATLSRFSYAYTPVGNITTWTQQYGTDVKAYDFTYDAADQLTGAVYRLTGGTSTIVKRYGYAYDPTGNRTTARTDDTPLLSAYNNMNRLTTQSGGGVVEFKGTTSEAASVRVAGKPATGAGTSAFAGSAVLASGTSTVEIAATDASGNTATQSYEVDVPSNSGTFTYDANGNLTAQGTKTYEWDAANRLVRVADGSTELARFVYDGSGRRVQKITGVTRLYVYGGPNILQERVGSATTRTVHGPGIDQPLASIDAAGVVSYYLTDHLGSVVQLTSAAGAITLTRQYDPYGVALQGAEVSGYGFTGREWDAEVSLYYYRARYHDPKLGRFLSEDPISPTSALLKAQLVDGTRYDLGQEAHDALDFNAGLWPEDLNLYTYVYNSPQNLTDPTGEHPAARAAAAAAAAAARQVARGAKWVAAWTKKNVKGDGPSAGYPHSQGRFCQVRVKNQIIVRVDLHPRRPGGPPRWHVHFFPPSGGEHGFTLGRK